MTDIRIKKIFADISTRKTRTFLVSASIFVGVLGVIALFSSRNLINTRLTEDLQLAELSMIDVTVSVNEDAAVDNGTYLAALNREDETGRAIPALEGIERVEGQAFYPIDWRKPDGDTFTDAELRSYWTPLDEVQIEPMRLVAGEWPQVGQNQVVVEQRFADLHDFELGDAIVLRALNEDGQTEDAYTITGFVFHPYIFKGLTGDLPGPEMGIYAQYTDAQNLLQFTGFSKIIARYETFEQALANYQGFQNAVLSITPYVPVFPTYENPVENAQVSNAAIFNDILTALALVTMVVSGFLVVNVISQIVAEQKRQIGSMKAIGADARDNFFIYAGIALVYGALGTVFAIIPGIIFGYFVTLYLAPQLDILVQGFLWSPQAVLIGVVMGLIVPILSACIPVYNGVRVRIIDAFTDLGISSGYETGAITQLLGRLPLPITVKQAVINVYQKRASLLLTVVTLIATVATFMATIAIALVLNSELAGIFDRLNYEFEVTPNQLQEREVIEPLLLAVDGVQRISPAALFFIEVEGAYENFFTGNNLLQVFGIDPSANVADPVYLEGRAWLDDPTRDGIVITIPVADQTGIREGEELTIFVGGQRVTREVIAVDRNGFDQALMKWDDLAKLAGSVSGVPRPNEYVIAVRLEGRLLPVFAAGLDESLLTFLVEEVDGDERGVILTESLASAEAVSVGDSFTMIIGSDEVQRRVDAVIPNAALEAAAEDALPGLETIPQDVILFGFSDLVAITGVNTDGDPVPNAYYVTIEGDDPSSAEVDAVMERMNAALLDAGIASRFTNRVAFAENLNRVVATNISIILVAAMLIALVGAIGLLTTLSIAVIERQKEIGVLRSIGADSTAIALQFVVEGQILALIAWLVSIPFSYYMALGLFQVFQLEYTPFTYPVEALIAGLIGIVVISALSSLGPSLSAARKTVSEILRYQ